MIRTNEPQEDLKEWEVIEPDTEPQEVHDYPAQANTCPACGQALLQVQQEQPIDDDWATWTASTRKTLKDKKKKKKAAALNWD